MTEKIDRLQGLLHAHAPLLVAYSGGVDSTCLLAVARWTLGNKVLGVIADSPSLPRKALASALNVAKDLAVEVEVIVTRELENPLYVNNPPNRCYFCKAELFARMNALAAERGFAAIAYGENADDPATLRTGSRAAAEFAVLAPLKQAGFTKEDVRHLSRIHGLPTAESPAQPCLSSRIPHGTPVTADVLSLVERGEEVMRSLGFRIFRVRYLPTSGARVQVAPDEMPSITQVRARLFAALGEVGFKFIEVDPKGYRAPSL
jgi:pyridinium-3,5-biscarboxylic acid mononucleotide sulfurtransferase